MKTALTVVFILVCVIITILVLFQEAKDNGLGSLAGGSAGETYWSKNKGRSMDKERVLVLATTIAVVVFLALALLISSKVLN
ncbi:MAG: preprotein translocase subunit SecG [Lachnospiraceae bacterium]|nr:preprotein translocase subunit SecG [Lachnospiraceae bacterium]MDE6760759.1 preprotein translocase subunit SecG [Lachnospiraceae bacterium]